MSKVPRIALWRCSINVFVIVFVFVFVIVFVIFFFWSCDVPSSLWSNVFKVTSLWDHSAVVWRLWLLVVPDQPTKGQGHLLSCRGTAKNKQTNATKECDEKLWQTNKQMGHRKRMTYCRLAKTFLSPGMWYDRGKLNLNTLCPFLSHFFVERANDLNSVTS